MVAVHPDLRLVDPQRLLHEQSTDRLALLGGQPEGDVELHHAGFDHAPPLILRSQV